MDEQKLIVGPVPSGWMQRCILIAPCAEYEAWLAAITAASIEQGFELVVIHGETVAPVEGDDPRVFLSTNKKFLFPTDNAEIAVIYVNTPSAIDATARLTGSDTINIYTVMDASTLLVDALTFPNARLVTDQGLRDAGSTLELLPGLVVKPPPHTPHAPVNDIEQAGIAALAIFADGLPPVQAACDWADELFFFDMRRHELRERLTLIDITGGPRMLANGSHITLPAGEWEVVVDIALNQDAAEHDLVIEWGTLEEGSTLEVAPGRPGLYRVTLSYVWTQTARAELRIRLAEGAMGGEFEFINARVTRIG